MTDESILGLSFPEPVEVSIFDALHNVRVDTKRFVDRVHLVYRSPTNKLAASVLIWACKRHLTVKMGLQAAHFSAFTWGCEKYTTEADVHRKRRKDRVVLIIRFEPKRFY